MPYCFLTVPTVGHEEKKQKMAVPAALKKPAATRPSDGAFRMKIPACSARDETFDSILLLLELVDRRIDLAL